jgi:hypothetical protein
VRTIGVTEVTYYRWRREYGGLQLDQVRRMTELEQENTRLRKAVSDLTARQDDPGGGCQGKLLSPSRRRLCIDHVRIRAPRLRGARAASFDAKEAAEGPEDEEQLTLRLSQSRGAAA